MPDYGLLVRNAGSTVIIDGTSNMHKIVATGTLQTPSFTNSAGASSQATVTLATGLTTASAYAGYINRNVGLGSFKTLYLVVTWSTSNIEDGFDLWTEVVNTNETKVTATTSTSRTSGTTAARDYRYYIYKETAI